MITTYRNFHAVTDRGWEKIALEAIVFTLLAAVLSYYGLHFLSTL